MGCGRAPYQFAEVVASGVTQQGPSAVFQRTPPPLHAPYLPAKQACTQLRNPPAPVREHGTVLVDLGGEPAGPFIMDGEPDVVVTLRKNVEKHIYGRNSVRMLICTISY